MSEKLKLKCCLNYELDMYLEGIKEFPKTDIKLKTQKGNAFHVKTDVFKKTMWYSYPGESELFSMTPNRVKEIIEMNRSGDERKIFDTTDSGQVELAIKTLARRAGEG